MKLVNKDTVPVDTRSISETTFTRHQKTIDNKKPETSNTGHFSAFPPLPLPPRECCYSAHRALPTEDNMGTLYAGVTETNPQPSSSSSQPADRDTSIRHEANSDQSAPARFVPRTTRLENRKRRLEEDEGHSLAGPKSNNEPLIGPKLPEPPKLDMEDESLNTTMNLIRSTMKKVTQCVHI